jgi:sterol desaturase/sphingolipid hydroxylase (fatty acid hydroxylase superfamily)
MKYIYAFGYETAGYADYLFKEIFRPTWHSYFYWLMGISLMFWGLEMLFPWRKNQLKIRKDFWLDGFYMFFNFFIFSLIGFAGVAKVFVTLFDDLLELIGVNNLASAQVQKLPYWLLILFVFLSKDAIQYFTHRMLHAIPKLWEFHKVHHSVQEMGFAAHLRFHWMESIIYKTIQYIPLSFLGIDLIDFFYADLISIAIGHFNHANIKIPLGPFKYILNNPQMHIWHHAKEMPRPRGANFGISLSLWDYLFKTDYLPTDGRDILLGFDAVEDFPDNFFGQIKKPFEEIT